jgi:hypothetical protein
VLQTLFRIHVSRETMNKGNPRMVQPHARPLWLSTVVRNARTGLQRCLSSLAGNFSCCVISDAGSTGATQDFPWDSSSSGACRGAFAVTTPNFNEARDGAVTRACASQLRFGCRPVPEWNSWDLESRGVAGNSICSNPGSSSPGARHASGRERQLISFGIQDCETRLARVEVGDPPAPIGPGERARKGNFMAHHPGRGT